MAEVGPVIPFGPARLRDILTRPVAAGLFNGLFGVFNGWPRCPQARCEEEAGSKFK
jgi:hypothetical protein